MKSIAIFISLLLLPFAAQAQAPLAFKYQAVVRDAAGQVLANQFVGIEISLLGPDTLYTEVHSVLTNASGLVNLNIGKGTPLHGDFSQILWGQQPIFVLLSLDVSGGTNYQFMGASELLSVPYALHAANGLPTDAQTGDILFYNGTSWQGLPAGAAGTVLTMGADGRPFWKTPPQLDSLIKVPMTNGDVIYVHPTDNSDAIKWGFSTNIIDLPGISNFTVILTDFSGESSSAIIVAQLGDNNGMPYGPKMCTDLVAFGFDDWYLPASGELNEMYKKLGPVANGGSGQMPNGLYWSSSEYGISDGWAHRFSDGVYGIYIKDYLLRCRCVRK